VKSTAEVHSVLRYERSYCDRRADCGLLRVTARACARGTAVERGTNAAMRKYCQNNFYINKSDSSVRISEGDPSAPVRTLSQPECYETNREKTERTFTCKHVTNMSVAMCNVIIDTTRVTWHINRRH
jgi:hypothetical protein